MKSVVASIGMFAAVANAYNYPHHMHFRRDNGTDYQTTMTVQTTVVETITSCAPTVTNCPADKTGLDQLPDSDKTVYPVTHTVVLTEVVCPVTEASAIYTSVLHEAETGGVTGKTLPASSNVPMSTGAYPAPSGGAEHTPVVSDYTTDQVVTLTQGDDTITTTIHKTLQTTVTLPYGPAVTNDGSKGNGTPEDDTTTTTTKTSTGTITKTIQRTGSETNPPKGGDDGYSTGKETGDDTKGNGSGDKPNNGSGSDEKPGNGNGNGSGECVPETVTVTAPASTVYVTVVPEAAKTGDANDATVTGKAGSEKGDDKEHDDDEGDDEDDEEEYCDTTTTLEATVTVVPYPVNGTTPTGAGYAKPTGFARRLR